MAKTLQEELIVKISADVSDLSKKIDQANGKVGGFASSAKKLGGIMAGAFAVSKVAEFGKAIIMGASDMEESLNKVNVVFGNSSQQVIDFANNSLTAFGIAKGEALEATSLFGDMATSMGLNNQEASEMAMSMTALSGDLASFKNIRTDVAQTALKGIFTGETESLKSLGIVMTEANLEQFAMEQGIQKNIKSMTQAEKVNLRYAFVMDKTKTAQGDFAKTSDGSANQMRIFQQSMAELGAELGAIVLPLFNKLIKFVNRLVAQVRTGLPKIKAVFSNTFRAIQNAIIAYLQFFLKNNPFSLIIQGVNAVARTFKMTELANPFERMAKSLEGLKATIPEVTEKVVKLKQETDGLNQSTTQTSVATTNVGKASEKTRKVQFKTFEMNKVGLQGVKFAQDEVNQSLKQIDMTTTQVGQNSQATADLTAQGFLGASQSIINGLSAIGAKSKGLALLEIATNTAMGIAGAVKAGAGVPFPANLPAIASGIGAVLAGMAGAKSALAQAPAFAMGGIVGGTSFQGDRVLARVNSGEMILNKAQQGRLFGMINNPNMGASVGFGGRLRGEDIFFSQERSTNRLSRYR